MSELNWDAPWCAGEIATLHDCFHRVSVLTIGDKGWERLQGHGGGHQQVLRVSRDVSFYRTQNLVDIPADFVEDVLRPEAGNGVLTGQFEAFLVATQLAPADLMLSPELAVNQHQKSNAPCHLRYVMRRECPSGQVSFVVAPCDETGEHLWEQTSSGKARFVSLAAVDGGKRTLVTEIVRLYCVPEAAIKLHVGGHDLPAQLLAHYQDRQLSPEVRFSASPEYMVVCIRRCGRGPPLLPKTAELGAWECAERTGFSLPRYLVRFAAIMGLDLKAWDSLDGRQLAPFQAAVRVDQWARCWPHLETGFRAQCRAYRSVNRISAAPTLVEGVEPRFVQAPAPAAPEHLLRGLEVRNTFIDAQRPSPPSRRCSSLPPA
mmetsp:Transcript_45276/g.119498  ORF Transcript_45276/g.119498 Transcript_45276/m.119498 type:complete len:374 (+) Transcript_45276:29-1150(+)